MDKMMTFEEWDNLNVVFFGVKDPNTWKKFIFDRARLGMIPAENAVVVHWSEAPEDAIGLELRWDFGGMSKYYFTAERPKPVWVPKVGEAVFWNHEDKIDIVAVLKATESTITFRGFDIVNTDIITYFKPFHESHIGKPWSEIPGGVE